MLPRVFLALLLSAAFTAPSQAQSLPPISLISDPWPVGPSQPDFSELVQHSDGWLYGTSDEGGGYSCGTVFRMNASGKVETLVDFTGTSGNNRGANPSGSLKLGADGNFYGMTSEGGAGGNGTVFKMTPSGALTTLVDFTGNAASNKGASPSGSLTLGADGSFYGMTRGGGPSDWGTVFKMTPAGTLTTLVEFTWNGPINKGANPLGSLTVGADGSFYGMTSSGGAIGAGTIFKMTTDGVLTTLVDFTWDGAINKGASPSGSLTLGADGRFYGMTPGGGVGNAGTVFKMTPDGVLTTLVVFTDNGVRNKGARPNGSLTLGADGSFYGMTSEGGARGTGTVFKMTRAGVLTTLVEFTRDGASNKGASPSGSLTLGVDGRFYGMTSAGGASDLGTAFQMTSAGVLTTLVEFSWDGAINKGAHPHGSLTLGADGSFFGMTLEGGASNYGTVFQMTPAGVLTTLVEFTGNGASNRGARPYGSLTLGADGNFYGMTSEGGASNYGTVFQMTPAGVLTTLVEFTNNGASNKGARPLGSLTLGADGSFYGMTLEGGARDNGTVFKMTSAGVLTTLVEFINNGASNKGARPMGSLTLGADGSFYGMTSGGGAGGFGTVFKMTSAGVLTTLVEFTNNGASNKGASPSGSLTVGGDGSFYGMTGSGGTSRSGTVFQMTPAGVLTTLVEFTGNGASDIGAQPDGSLTLGGDGSFYGMTRSGGASNFGTVFQMTPTGALTTMVEFGAAATGVASGANPFFGHFTRGADGDLYGMTSQGGQNGGGIVFKLGSAPTLISPAKSATISNPISISFVLPAAALPGSVKLAFGATQLILATSQESAGPHSFTFSPAHPTASPEIVSGNPLPDGTYTVTLSYQDALGNASASSVPATNVVIDTVRPFLSFPFGGLLQREDAVTIKVPVTLNAAFGDAFSVPFTVGGSAGAGDAKVSASPLKFTANQTTAFISIVVKDDFLLEGDDTLTLTLGAPSVPGVWVYSPSVFTLTIVEDDLLPAIASDLVNRIVAVGDVVTFASGATGSAPLALKWKKGATTLPGETGTSLVLPPATLSAAAAYTFSATNQRGSDSTTAELAVVDRSDAIIRANAGTSPKLSIAAKGNRLTYRWRDVNGDLSTTNPRYAGVTTATLTVKGAVVGDTGHYTCRVTSPGGTLDSGDRFLQVPSVKPIANTPVFPDVVIHNAFSYQLTFDADATRAPTRFLCTGLPKGVTCHPTTGLIRGKPTETGDFTVVVTMSNSADTADTVQDTFKVLAYPSGAVGSYAGVIGRNTKANADLGGRIDLTTTPLGGYTGTLRLGATSLKLTGTLVTAPTAGAHPGVSLTLARAGKLPVVLMVDIDPATNDLTGSVYEQGETGSSNIVGWRNVWTTTAPTQRGAHSFKIDPAATGPLGYGFGTITVSATGVTTVKGQTADGGVVVSKGLLGPDGEVLVYAPMLGNKASLLGTLAIDGDTNHTINSTLSWQKTAVTKAREYAPFGPLTVAVKGGIYVEEAPVLGLTDAGVNNAQFLFSDAGVPSLTNPNVAVYIDSDNKLTLSDTNPGSVKMLSFDAGTGAFTGQFTLKDAPATPRTVKFQGWLVPTESRGYGYFLLPQLANPPATSASTSPILSGRVMLE